MPARWPSVELPAGRVRAQQVAFGVTAVVLPVVASPRATTIWQYWQVPALSGLLPTRPGHQA